MSKDTVVQLRNLEADEDLGSTMFREGAQHLVSQAVKAELGRYLRTFVPRQGRALPSRA